MHALIREHLEDYLSGDPHGTMPPDFYAHIRQCDGCRLTLARMRSQAELLRELRWTGEEPDPAPGFYARLMARIDAERAASLWNVFLDPVFGRALALTSAIVLLLLGGYLVSSERSYGRRDASMMLIAAEPNHFDVEGSSPERDRQAVLVTLASYEE